MEPVAYNNSTIVLGVKWVAVAPLEVKLGPNESYRHTAFVKPPPGATKAQIRGKIIVTSASGWAAPAVRRFNKTATTTTQGVNTWRYNNQSINC